MVPKPNPPNPEPNPSLIANPNLTLAPGLPFDDYALCTGLLAVRSNARTTKVRRPSSVMHDSPIKLTVYATGITRYQTNVQQKNSASRIADPIPFSYTS